MGLAAFPGVGRRFTAGFVGPDLDAVRSLLCDGLDDIGIAPAQPGEEPPDLVFAIVDRADPAEVVVEAVVAAGTAPVVAVLSLADEIDAAQAMAAGARACYALSRSLDELRAAVIEVLAHAQTSALASARVGPDPVVREGSGDDLPPGPDHPVADECRPVRGRRPPSSRT